MAWRSARRACHHAQNRASCRFVNAASRFAHANSVPRIASPRNTTSQPGPGSGHEQQAAHRDRAAEHANGHAVDASQHGPSFDGPADAAEDPSDRPIGPLAVGDLVFELRLRDHARTRYIAKLEMRRLWRVPTAPV